MIKFDAVETRKLFEGRLESLENDARRAYAGIDGIRPAPFPIMMYAFAMIDYFSSYWAGWNDERRRPTQDMRNQTWRMTEFLEKYLKYPKKESFVAIQIWRHKLMHTSEPRNLKDQNSQDRYQWALFSNSGGIPRDRHWTLMRYGNDVTLSIGIFYLVDDLKNGVLGSNGYFHELCNSIPLQHKFEEFRRELDSYTIDLSAF